MNNRFVVPFVGLWLVVLGLVGCATVVRPVELFSLSNEDFVKRLRWLDYQGMAQHLVEGDRGEFLDRFADNEDFRVVDLETERIDFQSDGRQAVVWYVLEYYLLPSATVKKERFRLVWEFREEHKLFPGVWLITTEFPQLP
jgi:hypothetical protein